MVYITNGSTKEPKRRDQCQYNDCKRIATFKVYCGVICSKCIKVFIKEEIDNIQKRLSNLQSIIEI